MYLIGVDIGASYVKILLFSQLNEKEIGFVKKPFQKFSDVNHEIENNICELISEISINNNIALNTIKGIGISLPALFDRKNGTLINWPNNKLWNNYPLKDYLSKKYSLPIVMEDDANCAALGEYYYNKEHQKGSMIYLTVSSGIGCGIIINNELYIGENGWAGEVGHIQISNDNTLCTCGNQGCFQAKTSGNAILTKIRKQERNILDINEIAVLAKNNTNWALDIFDECGKYLGDLIMILVMTLDISNVVIGGGVAKYKDVLFSSIHEHIDKRLETLGRRINLTASKLGDKNGVFGAVRLINKVIKENN